MRTIATLSLVLPALAGLARADELFRRRRSVAKRSRRTGRARK